MPAGNSSHRALFVTIALAVAILLRLFPTLFNGAPWGTDAWPLFKDTQLLLANTPTKLGGNSAIFADQYDIYWPGSIVFGAISSLVFNIVPIQVMPIIIPLAAALSTFFLFVIVEKLTGSTIAAFVASIFFTTSSFDSIFTASVTKETFAYPLFMIGILVLAFSLRYFSFKNLALFALVSLALVMAHDLIALILAVLAASIVFAKMILSFRRGMRFSFDFRLFLMPIALLLIIGGYLVYAWPGFQIPVSLSDVLSLSSFIILSIAVSLYFTLTKQIPVTLPALILAGGIAVLAFSMVVPILPFQPLVPSSIVFDAIPYMFVGLLALIGYNVSHKSLSKEEFSFFAVWIAIPIGLFGFSVFGTPNGLDFVYRLFTFIYLPAAVLGGIALSSLIEKKDDDHEIKKSSFSGIGLTRLKKTAFVFVVLIIAILCTYQSYAAVVQGQNLLGGQWGYTPSDISSAVFTKGDMIQNMNVSGDSKILYLFGEYYGIGVNVANGYQILVQGISNESSSPLITDKIMQLDGYNIQLYGNKLPLDWQSSLLAHSSLVYTNGNDEIWY